MEEELPPGFWEEAQEPHPSSSAQQRQVKNRPDSAPTEKVSAAPPVNGATSAATVDDPGFETVQALFPGRILSIEAEEDGEEGSAAAGAAVDGEEDD